MITKMDGFLNEELDKTTKSEIQQLRTMLNIYKKHLGMIEHSIKHTTKKPYDYGEAAESKLEDIKEIISDCKTELYNSEQSNKQSPYGKFNFNA